MSTGENTSTIVVWAWTDRGDVATRVLDPAHLPEIIAEVARMRDTGVIEVEIDGQIVARSNDMVEVLAEVDEYLAGAEPAATPTFTLTA